MYVLCVLVCVCGGCVQSAVIRHLRLCARPDVSQPQLEAVCTAFKNHLKGEDRESRPSFMWPELKLVLPDVMAANPALQTSFTDDGGEDWRQLDSRLDGAVGAHTSAMISNQVKGLRYRRSVEYICLVSLCRLRELFTQVIVMCVYVCVFVCECDTVCVCVCVCV